MPAGQPSRTLARPIDLDQPTPAPAGPSPGPHGSTADSDILFTPNVRLARLAMSEMRRRAARPPRSCANGSSCCTAPPVQARPLLRRRDRMPQPWPQKVDSRLICSESGLIIP
jgi:hypothetical protein